MLEQPSTVRNAITILQCHINVMFSIQEALGAVESPEKCNRLLNVAIKFHKKIFP